ncbi:MAG: glycosyltransferase family 4 protein, partial [Lachnospiraceae bacterium]|nr:glycosyltransferase family 4 protein [Lachnospiraceae bacterium]
SVSEGFSTSILEAAFCRCYIVTTYRGGSKELVISEDYGTIIPTDAEDLVYDALEKAIADPAGREKACENCYNKLVAEFTWDITATKLIEIAENEID